MQPWFAFAIIALAFWGVTGVTQKLSTNNLSFEVSFLWFSLAFLPISLGIVVGIPLDWGLSPSIVGLAALGGLLNGLGALTSFAALEHGGKASIVIPIVSLYPLVTLFGAWLFLGERLSLVQLLGVICALVAVALLSQEADFTQSRL